MQEEIYADEGPSGRTSQLGSGKPPYVAEKATWKAT